MTAEPGDARTAPQEVSMPCPECVNSGHSGAARIGNRRGSCKTCNAFAQRVRRLTFKLLTQAHPNDYAKIRAEAELCVYQEAL